MISTRTNVLITGTGGCGVGEGVYKALKDIGHYNLFSCNHTDNSLFLRGTPNPSFIVPNATSDEYCSTILEICENNEIKAIIPGSEQELVVLAKNRDYFQAKNVIICANSTHIIESFNSKLETFKLLKSLSIKTPDTTTTIGDVEFFQRNKFPLIIKPIFGNASKNVFVLNSYEELHVISKYLELKAIEYVVQEYVGKDNEEFTISILSDFNSQYLGGMILKRKLSGGFSQVVTCDKFPELLIEAKIISTHLNSKGPLNIQCRIENGKLNVFEINPRFSGTTPFRALFGFNEPEIFLNAVLHGLNTFDVNMLKYGYLGVRGFKEEIYNCF